MSFFVRTNYLRDPAGQESTGAQVSEVVGAYATRETAEDAAEQTRKQLAARGDRASAIVQVLGEGDEVLSERRTDE